MVKNRLFRKSYMVAVFYITQYRKTKCTLFNIFYNM